MSSEVDAKQKTIAKLIDGQVVDSDGRVAVCVKGVAKGFPATFEAFSPGWPFGCSYAIETNLLQNPQSNANDNQAKISVIPRVGRGLLSFFFHTFLFESKGMPVNDKKLQSRLIFSYDDQAVAMRFIKYPGVADLLLTLESECKMKEMIIKTDAGIYLSQANSFNSMNLDLCKATFNFMADLGQVLADSFSD
ncbi:MAG: hypothetical protein K2W82_01205 [Candidatus Obscuribacterales bacterium]|nr:hypothetical protein [Candidatus Obscuribacterales bacterium]